MSELGAIVRRLDAAAADLERELETAGRRRGFTITKLERDPAGGFWRGRVTGPDGIPVAVDRRSGSWQAEVRSAPRSRTFERRDVLAPVAAALQEKVRPLEKAERDAQTPKKKGRP